MKFAPAIVAWIVTVVGTYGLAVNAETPVLPWALLASGSLISLLIAASDNAVVATPGGTEGPSS